MRQRVGVGSHLTIEIGGVEKQVVERFAVAVVVETFTERLQLRQLIAGQPKRRCRLTRRIGQIVAKCGVTAHTRCLPPRY